jgi:glucose-6-phosphate-specific signal transduction histidine kinase
MQAILFRERTVVPYTSRTMHKKRSDCMFNINELSRLNSILTQAMLSLDWQLIKTSLGRLSLLPEISCFLPFKKQIEQVYTSVSSGIYATSAVYEITDFLADNMSLFLSSTTRSKEIDCNRVTITQKSTALIN